MDYNYHTHTYRCNHATGTEEDYINRAIECGIKYMGFADHVPLMFEDGYETLFRVPVSKAREYVTTISEIREKYKDKIDIKIGFEMEYYPELFDTMLENVIDYGAEYLILGAHFANSEHPENREHSAQASDSVEKLKTYVDRVVEGMKTGVFTYIAHPDMINFTGDVSVYKSEMRKICKASKETGIPLEINCLGIRDNRAYPRNEFWEIAGEEQSPVVFGFDTHDTPAAYDSYSVPIAEEIVKKYKLNYIGRPKVILLQK